MLNYKTLFIQGKVQLTPNQEKVAKYILENAADATYVSTNQMADALNVSNASIFRLSQALGFEGYGEPGVQKEDEGKLYTLKGW
jgi:DNA-binding MurR/RpiR family transcriptional regulator